MYLVTSSLIRLSNNFQKGLVATRRNESATAAANQTSNTTSNVYVKRTTLANAWRRRWAGVLLVLMLVSWQAASSTPWRSHSEPLGLVLVSFAEVLPSLALGVWLLRALLLQLSFLPSSNRLTRVA